MVPSSTPSTEWGDLRPRVLCWLKAIKGVSNARAGAALTPTDKGSDEHWTEPGQQSVKVFITFDGYTDQFTVEPGVSTTPEDLAEEIQLCSPPSDRPLPSPLKPAKEGYLADRTPTPAEQEWEGEPPLTNDPSEGPLPSENRPTCEAHETRGGLMTTPTPAKVGSTLDPLVQRLAQTLDALRNAGFTFTGLEDDVMVLTTNVCGTPQTLRVPIEAALNPPS